MSDAIVYPDPPWHLKGYSLNHFFLLPSSIAQRWVPEALEIVTPFSNKTIAGFSCISYLSGPDVTCSYNEFAFTPAYVRYKRARGFYISHMFVDCPMSLAAGLGVWGLPKKMAVFDWRSGHFHARCEESLLIDCAFQRGFPLSFYCSLPFPAPFISFLKGEFVKTHPKIWAKFFKAHLLSCQLQIDGAPLSLPGWGLSTYFHNLTLSIDKLRAITP